MQRKLNREEFSVDLGFDRELLEPFLWPVYDRYELLDDQDNRLPNAVLFAFKAAELELEGNPYLLQDGRFPYFRAPEDSNPEKFYEPLIDTPHLFLEFARAGEREDPETIQDWISRYGLLGLHRVEPNSRSRIQARKYNASGGPGEAALLVELAAGKASTALAAWEAALSKDRDQLEEAIFGRQQKPELLENSRLDSIKDFKSWTRSSSTAYADALLDVALVTTAQTVQQVIEEFAYPSLEISNLLQPPGPSFGPELLQRTWKPRNLLGAMYLQFYWLITSTGELPRCKYCTRLLYNAPPMPGTDKARRPRKDKQFCDSRCRQNYHYHNRIRTADSKG